MTLIREALTKLSLTSSGKFFYKKTEESLFILDLSSRRRHKKAIILALLQRKSDPARLLKFCGYENIMTDF